MAVKQEKTDFRTESKEKSANVLNELGSNHEVGNLIGNLKFNVLKRFKSADLKFTYHESGSQSLIPTQGGK